MDFGANTRYKTKKLGYQLWGWTNHKYIKTDWIYKPSTFINFADAVRNSGLGKSLKNINDSYNDTLNNDAYKLLFNNQN